MDQALTLKELHFSKKEITSELLDEYFIAILSSSQLLNYGFVESIGERRSSKRSFKGKIAKILNSSPRSKKPNKLF